MEKVSWGIKRALCEIIWEESCIVQCEKRQVFKIKSDPKKNKDEEVEEEAEGIKTTFIIWAQTKKYQTRVIWLAFKNNKV